MRGEGKRDARKQRREEGNYKLRPIWTKLEINARLCHTCVQILVVQTTSYENARDSADMLNYTQGQILLSRDIYIYIFFAL